jgi:hypothetical protein
VTKGLGKLRTVLSRVSDPDKPKKLYTTVSALRKAELRVRNIADGEPDLTAFPGGLFDPSKPSAYQPLRPTDLRRLSSIRGRGRLFVDSDERHEPPHTELTRGTSSAAVLGSTILAPVEQHSQPDRAHRFFRQHNLNERSRVYGETVPLAPAPASHIEPLAPSTHDSGINGSHRIVHTQAGHTILATERPASTRHLSHLPDNGRPQPSLLQPPWYGPRPVYSEDSPTRDILDLTSRTMLIAPYAPRPNWGSDRPLEIEGNYPLPGRARPSSVRQPTQLMDRHRATCYYWQRNNRCKRESRCKYLHVFAQDIPLAPAPPLASDRKTKTCKFWSRGYCKRSDRDCKYLHGYVPHTTETTNTSDLTPAAVVHAKSASCPTNYDIDKLISDFSRPTLHPQIGIAEFQHGHTTNKRPRCVVQDD